MSCYETEELTLSQVLIFEREFNEQVGTEHERTMCGDFRYRVMCFDLEKDEVSVCVNIEKALEALYEPCRS